MPEYVGALALFVVGFFILIKGAQTLVRGASSAARVFGVSNWFIGIVLVGIGTSIPELAINIAAALEGSSVGLSAIIGSNTFNTLGILGISAIAAPFVIKRRWMKDVWLNVGAVTVAAALILLSALGDGVFIGITRGEGALLAGLFLLWCIFMLRRDEEDDDGVDYEVFTTATSLLFIGFGILGVYFGGLWVVDGAQTMALLLGVSPALVGLTAVAIGTSMPELTVSLVAAIRGASGIAVGNIIGSNIFDFLGILGITALIHPVLVREALQFDILVALAASVALLIAMVVGTRFRMTRTKGILFVLLLAAYFAAVIIRG